jgi:hypothetical protein
LFYILTYSQYQPLTHFIPQACLTSSRPYGMTVSFSHENLNVYRRNLAFYVSMGVYNEDRATAIRSEIRGGL